MPFPLLGLAAAWNVGKEIIGGIQQHSANQSAIELSNRNIAFQREMAETGVQKRVQDLMKAGLNPMLAYHNSATASGGTSIPELKAPMATASQVRMNAVAADNAMADTQLKVASADNQSAQAAKARWEAGEKGSQEILNLQAMRANLESQTDLNEQQKKTLIAGLEKIAAEVKNIQAETAFTTNAKTSGMRAQILNLVSQTELNALDLKQRKAINPMMVEMMSNGLKLQQAGLPAAEMKTEAHTVWWREVMSKMGFTSDEQDRAIEEAIRAAAAARGAQK